MRKSKEKNVYVKKSDRKLRKLAKEIYEGYVFTDYHINQNDIDEMLERIFIPLQFMDEEQVEWVKNCGLIYENMEFARKETIRDYPVFDSCKTLNREDSEILRKYVCILIEQGKGEKSSGQADDAGTFHGLHG